MGLLLGNWKLIAAGLALAGLLWLHYHEQAKAVENAVNRAEAKWGEKVAEKERERLAAARAHHARVAAMAKANLALQRQVKTHVTDDPRCNWNANSVRLLNSARGHPLKTSRQPSHALPTLARVTRAPDTDRSGGRRRGHGRRL